MANNNSGKNASQNGHDPRMESVKGGCLKIEMAVSPKVHEQRARFLAEFRSDDRYLDISPVKLLVTAFTGEWEPTLVLNYSETIGDLNEKDVALALFSKTEHMSEKDWAGIVAYLRGKEAAGELPPATMNVTQDEEGISWNNPEEFPLEGLKSWKTLNERATEVDGGMKAIRVQAYEANKARNDAYRARQEKWKAEHPPSQAPEQKMSARDWQALADAISTR